MLLHPCQQSGTPVGERDQFVSREADRSRRAFGQRLDSAQEVRGLSHLADVVGVLHEVGESHQLGRRRDLGAIEAADRVAEHRGRCGVAACLEQQVGAHPQHRTRRTPERELRLDDLERVIRPPIEVQVVDDQCATVPRRTGTRGQGPVGRRAPPRPPRAGRAPTCRARAWQRERLGACAASRRAAARRARRW